MTKQQKIERVIRDLSVLYPEAKAELNFSNPYETLVATILSAQCTDKRVNMVTESLFRDYPDAASISKLSYEQLEERIKECGLYRAKAKHITPPESSLSVASRSSPPSITPDISPTVSTAVTINIMITG